MDLSAGQYIGPYEIVSPLGAGGMGEVYRAHDAKLKRDVAQKILPAGSSRMSCDADCDVTCQLSAIDPRFERSTTSARVRPKNVTPATIEW
jgi:serine/threonine protein kinase